MNRNSKILIAGGAGLSLIAAYFVVKKKRQSRLAKSLNVQTSNNNPPTQGSKSKKTSLVSSGEWPLTKGSRGDMVKSLQRALNTKYKAGLKVDGDFGKDTATALYKFTGKTSVNALDFTKIVGNNTDVSKITNAGKESLLSRLNPFSVIQKQWSLLNKPV
jgi:hypothetical protein